MPPESKTNRPFLGAHVSTSGGVDKAPQRGNALGCECIQIFSKNQTRWKSKPLTDEAVEGFKKGMIEYGIKASIVHDSYLINLGSAEEDKWNMSFEAFLDEIDRCGQLGIQQLVFHPGSHLGKGEEWGLRRIAESLNKVIDARPDSAVKLLLEITAGQGTNLGYNFEQFAQIIDMIEDDGRIGVCFDTAHAYAAGYNIKSKKGYDLTWKKFDEIIGLDRLLAFHLNDSKKDLGSRVDRHEHIGDGLLGLEPFRMLLNDKRFAGLGMYLETPQGDDEYIRNLKVLRALFK
ncbi:MAG: deoxyribonuclease IV [FCB group bacterium]|nr:deoxyribonuclease IV [FCB group bacterium]